MRDGNDGKIRPGESIIHTISAEPGTVGERILKEIAHPQREEMIIGGEAEGTTNERKFSDWLKREDERMEICRGFVVFWKAEPKKEVAVTLKLGPLDGLVLEEVEGCTSSFVAEKIGNLFILKVGKDMKGSKIVDAANKIVALYLCHGNGWSDRSNNQHLLPTGDQRTVKCNGNGDWRKRKARSDFFVQ